MKAIGWIFALLVIIFVVGYAAIKIIASKIDFDIKFGGIDFSSLLAGKGVDANLNIDVDNQNKFGLRFKILRISLFYDGIMIASSANKEKYIVHADAVTTIQHKIRFFINAKSLEAAKAIVAKGSPLLHYTVRLTIFGIPMSFTGDFNPIF